jgi:hypothetical protein
LRWTSVSWIWCEEWSIILLTWISTKNCYVMAAVIVFKRLA